VTTGIDIAWARPTVAQIKATGAKWVARYFSNDPTKNLTAEEVTAYAAAGIGTVSVWETTTGRATAGYAAGQADARAADAQRAADGLPADMVIHFAVDQDTTWASVAAYFAGAASVLGQARVGVYGGYAVIEGAHAAGYRWLWQTLAWSGGRWSAHATIRQTGGTVLGGNADIDEATVADFGEYPRPTPSTPTPPPSAAALLESTMGQITAGFGADATGQHVTHPELATMVDLGGVNTGHVGSVSLRLFCDFGTARLRVALRGPGGWDVLSPVDLDSTKGAVTVTPPDGTTHASILRCDRSAAGKPDTSAAVPVGYGVTMAAK
jgi:hypothetical protein